MGENIARGLNFVLLFPIKRSKDVRRTIRIHPNHNAFAAKAIRRIISKYDYRTQNWSLSHWNHLLVLIFGQLLGCGTLRELTDITALMPKGLCSALSAKPTTGLTAFHDTKRSSTSDGVAVPTTASSCEN